MSRKHYRTIAETIRVQREQALTDDARFGIECVATALALEFKLDNVRFKRDVFMVACGMSDFANYGD